MRPKFDYFFLRIRERLLRAFRTRFGSSQFYLIKQVRSWSVYKELRKRPHISISKIINMIRNEIVVSIIIDSKNGIK